MSEQTNTETISISTGVVLDCLC